MMINKSLIRSKIDYGCIVQLNPLIVPPSVPSKFDNVTGMTL